MPEPTPGYDDATVIPTRRLLQSLQSLEKQARDREQLFKPALRQEFEETLRVLRSSADELSLEHLESAERLINSLERYRNDSNELNLDQILSDLEHLKSFLISV